MLGFWRHRRHHAGYALCDRMEHNHVGYNDVSAAADAVVVSAGLREPKALAVLRIDHLAGEQLGAGQK